MTMLAKTLTEISIHLDDETYIEAGIFDRLLVVQKSEGRESQALSNLESGSEHPGTRIESERCAITGCDRHRAMKGPLGVEHSIEHPDTPTTTE